MLSWWVSHQKAYYLPEIEGTVWSLLSENQEDRTYWKQISRHFDFERANPRMERNKHLVFKPLNVWLFLYGSLSRLRHDLRQSHRSVQNYEMLQSYLLLFLSEARGSARLPLYHLLNNICSFTPLDLPPPVLFSLPQMTPSNLWLLAGRHSSKNPL